MSFEFKSLMLFCLLFVLRFNLLVIYCALTQARQIMMIMRDRLVFSLSLYSPPCSLSPGQCPLCTCSEHQV